MPLNIILPHPIKIKWLASALRKVKNVQIARWSVEPDRVLNDWMKRIYIIYIIFLSVFTYM